jgi:hypothetical protein
VRIVEPVEEGRDEFRRQVKAGLSDDQRTLYPQIDQDFAALAGSAS